MDKKKIIADHKKDKKKTDEVRMILTDGREVIEELVDENNHCHYLIKNKDNDYSIEDCQQVRVAENLFVAQPTIGTHFNK